MGDLERALDDYRHALVLAPFPGHFVCPQLWFLQMQQGKKELANQELTGWLKKAIGDTNYVAEAELYKFLLSQVSETKFLARVKRGDTRNARWERCSAWYYAGKKRLLEGDKATAAEYFRNCVATKERDVIGYRAALGELRNLNKQNK
jgi:lipoprotein NlpI